MGTGYLDTRRLELIDSVLGVVVFLSSLKRGGRMVYQFDIFSFFLFSFYTGCLRWSFIIDGWVDVFG